MRVTIKKDAELCVLIQIWSTKIKKKIRSRGHGHYIPISVCIFKKFLFYIGV